MLTVAQPGRGLQSLWYAGDQLADRLGVIMSDLASVSCTGPTSHLLACQLCQ